MIHLSPRQHEIARLVVQGKSNKGIASELKLSVRSVEEYVLRAAKRLPGDGKPRVKIIRWWFSVNYERAA